MEELTAIENKVFTEAKRLGEEYPILTELPAVLKKAAIKVVQLYELAKQEEDSREFTPIDKELNDVICILSATASDYPSHVPMETKEQFMEPFYNNFIDAYNRWTKGNNESAAFKNIGVAADRLGILYSKEYNIGAIRSIPTPGEMTYAGKRLVETKEKYPYLAELIDDPEHNYGGQFVDAFLDEGANFLELNEKDREALTMYHAVVIMEKNKITGYSLDKLSIDLYNQYIDRLNAKETTQEESIPNNDTVNTILMATADHMTRPNPVDLPSLNGFLATNVHFKGV